ncbi:ABC transporter permease [Lachnospiraceae bacterium]|nr:ABC transporter permease [Lachnospiraceae bacterium]
MAFLKILFKMIRYNHKSYKLYMYCNTFTMTLLFAFLSICSNDSFMHSYYIDSKISYNILAPAALICLFTILFLPYAYKAFLKGRKQEYSILMTLGMTEREVIANMFLECLTVSSIGCIAGLICGSGLAALFFLFLRYTIGLTTIQWEFHISAYLAALILYTGVIIIILFINILEFIKANLAELMSAKQKEERKKRGTMPRLIIGCGTLFLSFFIMLSVYSSGKTNLSLLSMGTAIIGIALTVSNFDSVMPKNIKRNWKISISFLMQHQKSWKTVTFLSASLFGLLIFFSGLSITLYSNSLSNAMTYSPYDLFYVQDHISNRISSRKLEHILNNNGVSVSSRKKVEMLRNGAFNIISAKELHKKLGTNYQPVEGSYIQLFQEDLNDGYEHSLTPLGTLKIPLKNNQELPLQFQEQKIEILFNPCKSLADITIIVNDKDFQNIKKLAQGFIPQNAIMINLDNWKISGTAIRDLQNSMAELNNFSEEDQYVSSLSSKIQAYTAEKQASEVLTFWIFFVDLMFFAAADIMICFKIKSELKEETRMIFSLYRIGITAKEQWNILLKKNFCYFLPSLLLGIIFGIFYNYNVNNVYHYGHLGWVCAGIVSVIVLILQILITISVTKHECRKDFIFD